MLKSRKEIMMKGKKIMLSKEGNYGNWVPANMMKLMWAGDIVLAVLTIVFAAVLKVAVPAWITGVLLVILLAYTLICGDAVRPLILTKAM